MKGFRILCLCLCFLLTLTTCAFANFYVPTALTAEYSAEAGAVFAELYADDIGFTEGGETSFVFDFNGSSNISFDESGVFETSLGTATSSLENGVLTLTVALEPTALMALNAPTTKIADFTLPVTYGWTDSDIQKTETLKLSCSKLGVSGKTADFTLEADTVDVTISLAAPIESITGITAKLVDTADASNTTELTLSLSDDKLSIKAAPVAAGSLTGSSYKVVVEGAEGFGFVKGGANIGSVANGATVEVTNFLPGDVTGNGTIDIYDFNALCSYVAYAGDDGYVFIGACDLNKDGVIDDFDIDCFIAAYILL